MIFIKKPLTDGVTAEIELNEDTKFYTRCQKCGEPVEATDEILDDFAAFLYGGCWIECGKCYAKRERHE